MSDFPPSGIIEDGKFLGVSQNDPVQSHSTDGGYKITRPRYTRLPRKVFTTGFTDLSQAQRVTLQSFYDSKRGGSDSFTWTDGTSGTEYTVRFGSELIFKRAMPGSDHRWNTEQITLEEE